MSNFIKLNNILNSKKKILKIFNKYKFSTNDIYKINDINLLFIYLCKIPNINNLIIKNCIENNKELNFNSTDKLDNNAFKYILNNFNQLNDKSKINDIMNNISTIKHFVNHISSDEINLLITLIYNKSKIYINDKSIYSLFKSLLIFCNKLNCENNNDNNNFKNILNELQNTTNIRRIGYYVNKISKYIDKNNDIDYNYIITIIENILNNDNIVKTNYFENLLELLNKCKKYKNKDNKCNNTNNTNNNNNKSNKIESIISSNVNKSDLEYFLLKNDKNINNYIFFLNSNNLLVDKESIEKFILNIDYKRKSFKIIDNLNLKRGFIFGITKNNKDYLLKYQPNKSFMELVINCYLNSLNLSNFLIPHRIFINNDNSYFYIIEKYNTDLYKLFNILGEKNNFLQFNQIIEIIFFILNSIEKLHKNNIVHCDLKLENVVLNYDTNFKINDLKIIDFDVALFEIIPESLKPVPQKYEKILNNKRMRGTRIYMLKNSIMTFNNDIYSLGVISLILFYKNTKLILLNLKKSYMVDLNKNKKNIIKCQTYIKKLNNLRDIIEDDENKIKMINLLCDILKKYNINFFFDENNFNKLRLYKEFIIDCIKTKYNVCKLLEIYNKILFNNL